DGSVSPTTAVTNASGQASTALTVGTTLGTETVHASATGVGSVDFNATVFQGSVLTDQVPAIPDTTDSSAYELGMKFQSTQAGQITAIRYWRAPHETGPHTGNIWLASDTGRSLVSVTFSGESDSGWQTQSLPAPLAIQPNTTYVVSVNVNA